MTTADHPGPWQPDVLGPGWEARTIELRPDAQGEAVATLVRRAEPPGGRHERAVLYVHGFVDYFFQTHLAEAWDELGYELYALDLRGYGRSLLPHQLPNYCTDLAVYAEELDRAARMLREDLGHTVVVGHGHSTGGLLLSLWAHARRGRAGGPVVDALVLNSPWLDLNRSWFDRVVTTRLVDVLGRVAPRVVVGRLDPSYGQYLSDPDRGGWQYDLDWKPVDGFPVRAGWLRTIRRGHRAVAGGLDVDVPVLVCASDATGPHDRPHDALDRTDSVLRVEHMVERAPLLGPDVTVVQIPGGIHDLALSRPEPRAAYFEAIGDWLARTLPGNPAGVYRFRHAPTVPHSTIRTFQPRRTPIGPERRRALRTLWPRLGFSVHDPTSPPPLRPDGTLDAPALFGRDAPLVLEIGSGMGEGIAAMAAADPDRSYLAVEAHQPGIAALLLRIEQAGLTNVRVAHGDALALVRERLAPGSLAAVHVFFPDPWPKARHHKRRIIAPDHVALLRSRLEPDGVLHCATDWAPYATVMLEVLTADPGLVNAHDGFAPRPEDRPVTKFERRGLALGHEIFDLVFRRRPDDDASPARHGEGAAQGR